MNNLAEEYEAKKAWGLVASINIYACDPKLISDKEEIRKFIIALVDEIKMKRHGEPLIERFAEGALEGYSALQFIETSSITLHFDEGENRAFIDIFSCTCFDHQAAEEFCLTWFKGLRSSVDYLLRY